MRQWWANLRASKYRDVPFVLFGVFLGWNSDFICSVKGVSMTPTIQPGEYIVFIPWSLLHILQYFGACPVKEGSVVLLKISDDLSVCKRVTRMTEGRENAEKWNLEYFSNFSVYNVDENSTLTSDVEYFEELSRAKFRSTDWDTCLDKGTESSTFLWVEGDNSSNSHDSRACGPVPMECLRGYVKASIWPYPHLIR
ncbi:Peptidase S24-like, putative [Angomonas deanei]|uniref:Peptidase S24-like, putative n=1 Tax=Angomonas deanei TaxID=59799 RepID=A0A7G2C3D2_9TRYP|nr:Peptidase S24-like, putative [Angomonas deanei]